MARASLALVPTSFATPRESFMTHARRLVHVFAGLLIAAPLLAGSNGSTPGADPGSRRQPPAPRAGAGIQGPACTRTVLVLTDNENNAGTGTGDGDFGAGDCVFNTEPNHPLEWNIPVSPPLPTGSATLVVRAFDVDDDEIDTVTFNGTPVGTLTGADDTDSTVVLDVPPGLVVAGNNRVSISVVETGAFTRCVEIVDAQLLLDGGCPATASCRSIVTDAASYAAGDTVGATVEVDTTLASETVRLEGNLIDQTGNIQATGTAVATITAADDPLTGALTIPAAAPGGTYTVQALVFDDASGALEDICTATVAVVGEGFTPSVPTLSRLVLALLAGLLSAAGVLALRRRG